MAVDPGGATGPLERALFERRTVLVSGAVDVGRAGDIAASMMALGALGDDPIELRINAGSDSLDAAFSLIDTIDALGVYIHSTVLGAVAGTMVGVAAVCQHRRIGPSGRIDLSEPRERYMGTAAHIERQAGALDRRVNMYLHRLADATGRPFEHLEADHRSGRVLDARQALSYGLVDEILSGR